MKTGPELIEEMRKTGSINFDDLTRNPNVSEVHIAALLGAAYALNPSGYFTFVQQLVVRTNYMGFIPNGEIIWPDVDKLVAILLEDKAAGKPWESRTIDVLVHDYCYRPHILSDVHMAALLGAIMVKGLSVEETAALTTAMTNSGDRMTFPSLDARGLVAVDKHSTGGIGDGVSLVLAPLVAAACPDVYLPMMSGRGLGHTGGTLDKLEAIPGFRVKLEQGELEQLLGKTRVAIFGQTERVAPADGKIYALRDATNCIANDGLIVASILSKKIAAGAKVLVMDAKYGAGAFLSEEAVCRNFAQLICNVGAAAGLKMAAVMTNMDEPLGRYAGNKLEVVYAVEALNGFHHGSRFMHVVYRLTHTLLGLAGKAEIVAAGDAIGRGAAYARFREMVTAQGGDASYLDSFEPAKNGGFTLRDLAQQRDTDGIKRRLKPEGPLHPHYIMAPESGYVTAMQLKDIGETIRGLGAGRYKPEDTVNPDVGVIFTVGRGGYVAQGDVLALVLHDAKKGNPGELERYITFSPEKPVIQPLVKERIDAA